MIVELLAGPLIGESFSFETEKSNKVDGGPLRGGELVIAMEPKRVRGNSGYPAHAEPQ
jgi:delta1-piperideine-2-carboxylate reductase